MQISNSHFFSVARRYKVHSKFPLIFIFGLTLGCSTIQSPNTSLSHPQSVFEGDSSIWIPEGNQGDTWGLPALDTLSYSAEGPFTIDMPNLPEFATKVDQMIPVDKLDAGRIESPISEEEAEARRAAALNIAPSAILQQSLDMVPQASSLIPGSVHFDSLDTNDCCGGGISVPPDPELSVGPNHIIAVVNSAFAIYNKSGTLLSGPTTFASFFSGVDGCTNLFDPNAIYDEEHDRFILGIDSNFDNYCVAVTAGSDPTTSWNGYIVPTNVGGNDFDYPHAGVGLDAIYMGANMFKGGFVEGRIWAIDKMAMYAGAPAPAVVTHSTGSHSTPQPMNLHGWAQGTWPSAGPHFILVDAIFNGSNYGVWSWDDPFSLDSAPVYKGSVNLNVFTGITAGQPIDAPQLGSSNLIQQNDVRVQDAEYRNGAIWMSHALSCNPGGGTVNCIRWAQIDPNGASPVVLEAGVFSSPGEYLSFPDLAANDCDDIAIGYSKTSAAMYPSVFVNSRRSSDPPGTLGTEQLLKAGERSYDSFQRPGPHRWGDYSGMTIDPDGQTFWYLGEYSKDITNFNLTTWGTYVGSFTFQDCGEPPPEPGQASNPAPANAETEVDIESNLTWVAGSDATTHRVHFGTVSPPPYILEQGGTIYDPGTLEYNKTYYWQIDEQNITGTTPGAVWSFTTGTAPQVTEVHLKNLIGASIPGARNRWTASVDIEVVDAEGLSVSNVLAEGAWSAGANGGASCPTDVNGRCSVSKSNLKANVSSVVFTVTNLSGTDMQYVPGNNETADSLTIYKEGDGNLLPVAVDDEFTATLDTPVSLDVLANDTEGEPPTDITVQSPDTAEEGTVEVNEDNTITYSPPSGFTGADSFDYMLTDGSGDSDIATVSIEVSAPGDDPLTLTVTKQKITGVWNGVLQWSGGTGDATVTMTRTGGDPVEQALDNDGFHNDPIAKKPSGTFVYEICDSGGCVSDSIAF
jgi:hypothetical protein